MGRSQVERNRARGRPGTKGRGRAGSGRGRGGRSVGGSSGDPPPKSLGSNAWRYETKASAAADNHGDSDGDGDGDGDGENDFIPGDELDEIWTNADAASGYEEHGPAHHEAMTATTTSGAERPITQRAALDVSAMANVLRNLATSDRLGVEHHVASRFDSRYGIGDGGGRRSAAKTVTEMRAENRGAAESPSSFPTIVSEDEAEVVIETEEKGPISSVERGIGGALTGVQDSGDGKSGNEGGGDEEEDLDAWLDSVIS